MGVKQDSGGAGNLEIDGRLKEGTGGWARDRWSMEIPLLVKKWAMDKPD